MSPAGKRIAASLGIIPFSFGVFLIAVVVIDDLTQFSDRYLPFLAYAPAATAAVAAWLLIWRRAVVWNRRAVVVTTVGTLLLLALPITATLWQSGNSEPLTVLMGAAPVIGWGLWMAGTIWLWPFRPDPIADPDFSPKCPSCGYLLTGLRATRCPECGHEPTLDELWSTMAGDGL